jgi:hypothetical protein
MVSDTLAYSGLAWAGNHLLAHARRAIRPQKVPRYTTQVVDRFDAWADELWLRCRDSYGLIAVRSSQALNSLYPAGFRCLDRLRVRHGDRDIGWVCVRSIDTAGTRYERHFGNLKLGIITDGLADVADATGVMEAAFCYLANQGVDVIVTYQLHPAWCTAAVNTGFMKGPSNCAFYRSPAVQDLMAQAAAKNLHCHLTASDGDGPEPV